MRTLIPAVATLALATAVPAQDGVKLFNGKDLSGWTFFLDKSGPNASGTMRISSAERPNCFTMPSRACCDTVTIRVACRTAE